MEGYKYLFDDSENCFNLLSSTDLDSIFSSFRVNKQCFGFIENGDIPPDTEAITLSKSLNNNLYNLFLEQLTNRPFLGYNNWPSNYASYNHLDSWHIFFSVIIWNFIETPIKNILEIGGGYANMLYLNRNQSFDKWTIIDLPHIGKLQHWMLNKLDISPTKYNLYSAYNYEEAISIEYDLIIGTHSLSELSITTFNQYFESTIKNAKYLLYGYHRYVHRELVDLKRNNIEKYFNIVFEVHTENNNVSICLFKHK